MERYWSYEFSTRPKHGHEPTMTDDFIVYKLMDQETETWCEIEHLQGHESLFLGLNSSMSVSALDKRFSPW